MSDGKPERGDYDSGLSLGFGPTDIAVADKYEWLQALRREGREDIGGVGATVLSPAVKGPLVALAQLPPDAVPPADPSREVLVAVVGRDRRDRPEWAPRFWA